MCCICYVLAGIDYTHTDLRLPYVSTCTVLFAPLEDQLQGGVGSGGIHHYYYYEPLAEIPRIFLAGDKNNFV